MTYNLEAYMIIDNVNGQEDLFTDEEEEPEIEVNLINDVVVNGHQF
jgi:hypothetical protein